MNRVEKDRKLYFRVHMWLLNTHGKATRCENHNCKTRNPARYEWALKNGYEYEKNIDNFIMLCPSCHRKYDFTEDQRLKYKKGRKSINRPIPINKIQQIDFNGNIKGTYNTVEEIHIKTGINKNSIHNVLSGSSKTAGGYIFKPIFK